MIQMRLTDREITIIRVLAEPGARLMPPLRDGGYRLYSAHDPVRAARPSLTLSRHEVAALVAAHMLAYEQGVYRVTPAGLAAIGRAGHAAGR